MLSTESGSSVDYEALHFQQQKRKWGGVRTSQGHMEIRKSYVQIAKIDQAGFSSFSSQGSKERLAIQMFYRNYSGSGFKRLAADSQGWAEADIVILAMSSFHRQAACVKGTGLSRGKWPSAVTDIAGAHSSLLVGLGQVNLSFFWPRSRPPWEEGSEEPD